MVNSLILYSIGLISGIAIVTLLNNSNKGDQVLKVLLKSIQAKTVSKGLPKKIEKII